jgi:hypothetical protein
MNQTKDLKYENMKYYKYLFIVVLFAASIISCKRSFLDDVNSKNTLFRQDYIIDLKTTAEYLNGVYTQLGQPLFNGLHVIYPELIADNIKPAATSGINYYNWNQRADESSNQTGLISMVNNCNGMSYGAYNIIRSCNYILEKAEEYREQAPATADSYKGQALAIRALTHFVLVNFFAQSYNFTADASHPGIAYVTSSNWTDPVKGRSTVADVYRNMILDLNNAVSLLPPASSSKITISKNAAMALLARIYLFKGDWIQAKNLARQVGIAVPIMTVNYPVKLFTPDETEALFQLPPSVTSDVYMTNFASSRFRGSISFRATADVAFLLNEDPGDVRKNWVVQVSANWNIVKFPFGLIPNPASEDLNGAYYHTVIRSSEMYLTAAEAYANLNNVDSAYFYLDAIRKRANTTAVPTTSTGLALLEAIYKERRKELAFEGLRMFDLLRWKKGVNRGDALSVPAQALPYPSNKAIAPIPGLDVKVSGLAQNEGY